MNYRNVFLNALYAFSAQGLSFGLSVIQSLLVPKLLGVEQYGYWQLFTFYASYVGFFHLGLNDGVYLLNGGISRGSLDKRSINSQYVVALVIQSLMAVAVITFIAMGHVGHERGFVIICTAAYMVIQNAATFLMFVLQAMNETKISSISTIVNRISYLAPLVIFLILGVHHFQWFVVAYLFSALLQLLYCSWNCRDILMSGVASPCFAIRESLLSIVVGSKLMLANIASTLILGVLRMAIDVVWGIEAFGKLSLSLSLVNFFLAFVSQAAMVLFPALRQSSDEEIRSFYISASGLLGVLFPSLYLFYFPLVWLLALWLPAYTDSLRYFVWLIPICVFDSKMNITCTTLFKVIHKESVLLQINVIATLCSAFGVGIAVFGLKSFEVAIVFSTLTIMGRSLVSERVVAAELGVKVDDLSVWEVVLTVVFMLIVMNMPSCVAFVSYASLYFVYFALHKGFVVEPFKALRRQR